jgi:hypothetical protein
VKNKMDFENAFINAWKNTLEERELDTIDFYKTKDIYKKLPVPKKKETSKTRNFKLSDFLKIIVFLFVILNIFYIILRLLGLEVGFIKPYEDVFLNIFEKLKSNVLNLSTAL